MGPSVGSLLRVSEPAAEFEGLFREVYLTFHRRDAPRSGMAGTSRAVLQHLVLAGPLTVGEMAAHLHRAQSVVSDIVTHLERDGLLEREMDPADRRRTLVWLTDGGRAALDRENRVLDQLLLTTALDGMPPADVGLLLDALRSLLTHASTPALRKGHRHD